MQCVFILLSSILIAGLSFFLLRQMNMYLFKILTPLLIVLVFSIPQLVIADIEKAAQLYEDAVIRLNDDDTQGAIIQLKNVLKNDPDMLPARVLLGKSYLQDGQPVNAEFELLNANRLGADRALTLPSLAQAYFLQFKYQSLIKHIDIKGLPADVQSELLVYIGQAQLKLGHIEKAADSFALAEQKNRTASAVSGAALVLMHQGKLEAAKNMLVEAEQLDANKASVWNVRASISHLQGNLKKALEEYGKVLELDKKDLDARLARIGIFLDLDNRAAAAKDIDYIREEYKYEPRSIYLKSVLLLREGNKKQALEELQEAANIISEIAPAVLNNNRALLMLAGMVFYDLKQYEQAITYLDLFVKKYPEQLGARKILGSIYLEQREYEKSLIVLQPAYAFAPSDPRLLALLGNAYMHSGQSDLAVELLEKAAVFSYEQADIRTDLALGYLSAGDQKLALDELLSIYEKDKTQTATGMVLTLVYYKLGQLDKALKLAEELIVREPDNVVFLNWVGSIAAANRQFEQARQYFERAVELDSNFIVAQINLGKLLLAQDRPEDARAHYLSILEQHPDHIATLIELARVDEYQGNFQKAIQTIKKTLRLNREQINTRSYLVQLYTRSGQTDEAFYMAEEVRDLTPEDMNALLTVVSTALAAGKVDDAKLSFKHMKDLALTDGDSFFRIARAELQAGFLKDAIKTMSLSLHYQPDYLPAKIILAESLLQDGQTKYANDLAIEIKSANPELAASFRLMGDVLMQLKRPKEAVKEYQQALNREAVTKNLLNLYQAMAQSNEIKKGSEMIAEWLKTHPDDRQSRYILAGANFQLGELESAQKNLQIILKVLPQQPVLLNNLANLYALTKDPRAIETARKAIELAPEDPAINDTLGWLLVQQGDADQGLRYLREAHFRKGDDLEIRYHIAVALYKLGRNKESLNELSQILSLKQDFKGIEAARKLQTDLKKR